MAIMPAPSDLPSDKAAGPQHHSSRLLARQTVLIGVKLRRRGESWFASRVTSLSREGFRLATYVRLEPGLPIWIMLPGFEGRRATVLSVGEHEADCSFDTPLHPAIFDYIMRMSDPAARG